MSGFSGHRPKNGRKRTWRNILIGMLAPALVVGVTSLTAASASASASPVAPAAQAVTVAHAAAVQAAPVAKKLLTAKPLAKPARVMAVPASSVVNGPGIFVPAGPHLKSIETRLFLGQYINRFGNSVTRAYCVQSGKALNRAQAFLRSLKIPGASTVVSQKVAWILSNWGDTSNRRLAAAVSGAVKYLVDKRITPDWKTWYAKYIPADVYRLANQMVGSASWYYGPHSLTVTLGSAKLVGQHVRATVVVRSKATGRAVPNVRVSVQLWRAKPVGTIPRTTGPQAVARFIIRATSLSALTVHATATIKQSVKLLVSSPSDQQELVSWYSLSETVSGAKMLAVTRPAAPRISISCTTGCNGFAPVTVRVCNPVGTNKLQYPVYDVDLARHTVTYRGSITLASGTCGNLIIVVADTHHVYTTHRYFVDGKWTATAKDNDDFIVDCPPLPTVGVSFVCDCSGKRVLVINIPANHSTHRQFAGLQYGTGIRSMVVSTDPGSPAKSARVAVPRNTLITVYSGTYRMFGVPRDKVVSTLTFP